MTLSLSKTRIKRAPSRQPQLKVDELREVFQACEEFDVPTWENRNKTKHCTHCNESLRKHLLHNCRLCGEVKCQDCTGKFYVPARFRKKGKSGPVRICWHCFDACEEVQSRLNEKYASRRTRDLQRIRPVYGELCMFPPRAWRHPDTKYQRQCFSCEMATGGSSSWSNCRLCGEIHCKTCSVKMDGVPEGYRRKGKSGPIRVCLQCRYKVIGGMKMFELRDMPVDSEEHQPPSATPEKSKEVLEVCIYTTRADTPEDRLVGVVRVTKQSTPVGVGAFFSQLHEEFITSFPRFATVNFHYLVGSRPIYPEHYDMLLCPPVVTIVPGVAGSSSKRSSRRVSYASSNSSSSIGLHSVSQQQFYDSPSHRNSQMSAGGGQHSSGLTTPLDGPSPAVSPHSRNYSMMSGSGAYNHISSNSGDISPGSAGRGMNGRSPKKLVRDASKRFMHLIEPRGSMCEASLGGFRRKANRRTNSNTQLPMVMPTPLPDSVDISPTNALSIPDMPSGVVPPTPVPEPDELSDPIVTYKRFRGAHSNN